jgi:RHS repeat-associated protein
MTTPLGATYRYSYHLDGWTKTGENTNTVLAANTVSGRVIETDVGRTAWSYSFGVGNSVVTAPDGTRSVIERYPSWLTSSGDSAEGLSGLVYRETTGNLLKIERRWKRLVFDGANDRSAEQLIVFNPVVSEEYKTIYSSEGDPVKTSATVFEHDLNGNILSSTAYDWFETALLERDSYGIPLKVPENVRVLSESVNHFHHSPTAADDEGIYHRNPSRVISTRIRSLSGRAVEELAYDGFMYSAPPTSGNLTAVRRWSDVDEDWLEEKMEFDNYGNVVRKTGPDGLVTEFSFMDEAKASPTSITRSDGDSSTGLTETFTFDFHTGHLISAIDANGHRSFIDYHNPLLGDIDPLGRPGRELKPPITIAGRVMSQGVHYLYEDSMNRVTIESDVFSEGDRGRKIRQTKDQLGRTRLIERNATGLDGFAIESRITYSIDGSSMLTENPRWRDRDSITDGWTRITRDPLGRTIKLSTFSGKKKPPFKGERDGWTGDITHRYDVDSVTIVDQAGKWTRRHSDAIGRLTRVEEPGSEGNLPLSEVSTFYSYDFNGNLTLIEQGSDSRHFEYDSLLRLTGESSPESGQSRYRHDARGNRVERTDANGTTTRYSYDWLGRLQGTEYAIESGSQVVPTPAVRYHYDDVAVQNSKGRLTAIVSDVAVRYIESYDELGRITGERLLIGGSEFRLGYEYTLGGQLIATILPSETRIAAEVDAVGDLESIDILRSIDPRPISVASSIKYHPTGLVAELKHGNGLWESHGMNARLQPTSFLVGNVRHSRNVFSLENHFTKGSRTHNSPNNGNIHRQVVVHGDERVEHLFEYDSLNRVGRFHGVRNGRGDIQETYRYDRNGNLLSPCTESAVGEKCSEGITQRKESRSTEVDTVRNAAGNVVQIEGIGRNVFDAENRLVRVEGRDGIGIASYGYDGEGRRISKTGFLNDSPISTEIYIHDSAGRLVAEYSDSKTHPSSGRRLFLTSDHLDSVRLVTDLNGRVVSRHDYKPFGQEIPRKTSSPGISRFAGYDRDHETGFYNAAARVFSSSGKRFLSPDPITVSPDRLKDPQRLNRFSYVRNNPLRFSDPTGEDLYIKITNIVVGYQYLIDLSSGKRIRTEVLSYRVIVTNDSGTRRIFELTRGSSHGKRGEYGRLQEAPPGEYTGKIRQDGRRGFRVELTEPGQPDGQLTTPDAIRNRGNIQLHRNGLYVEGCMTFPVSDYDRFQETITGMIEQDRIGGFGSKIFVSVIPRNARDGATDLFPGDGRISEGDLLGDQEGRNSKTKAIFDSVIPSSPRRLQ